MAKIKKEKKENQIKININPQIYPMEVIYGAAYVFLDRAYLKIDGNPKKEVIINIKAKKKTDSKGLDNLAGEFLNELVNYGLRYQISKNNRKIREYIVGTALLSAMGDVGIVEEDETKKDWQKDPLGIAVPWEERHSKKK